MARKSIGYTKLIWICPNCQTRIPGPKKTCTTCGTPQPNDVEFIQADREDLLKEQEEITRAKKGADIHCPYCGTRNTADARICSQCSGKLTGGKKRSSGGVVGAHKKDAKGIVCTSCGFQNKPNAPRCAKCGSALGTIRKRSAKAKTSGESGKLWLVIGFVITIILGFVFFKGCSRSSLVGVVEQAAWTRTVAVEQFIPVMKEDWWDDIPADAYVTTCEERYRYTSEEAEEGAIEVCGTPYTIDEGTGYGEVVQDCEFEVYDVYCEYEISDWAVVEILELEGYGPSASWPTVSTFSDQRAGSQTESYTIWFDTNDGSVSFETEDYNLFNSATTGSEWELTFDGFGDIRDISQK